MHCGQQRDLCTGAYCSGLSTGLLRHAGEAGSFDCRSVEVAIDVLETFSRCRRQDNRNHPALNSEGVTQPRSLEPYGRISGYRKHGSSTRHSHTLFPALCNVQPSHSVSKEQPASQVHLTCILHTLCSRDESSVYILARPAADRKSFDCQTQTISRRSLADFTFPRPACPLLFSTRGCANRT